MGSQVSVSLLKEAVPITTILENYGWIDDVDMDREWSSTLCPFHDDSSPSASVNVTTDRFTCFVCQISGDIIDVVSWAEDLEFPEAVEYIVQEYL